MKKAVFMNLAIDQLFDSQKNLEKIFSVRIPSSERLTRICEDFAVFFADPEDLAIQYKELPQTLRRLFLNRGVKLGPVLEVPFNPFDYVQWLSFVAPFLDSFDELQTCGISVLEESLRRRFNVAVFAKLSAENFSELNNKTWLPFLASKYSWNFPETEILSTPKLFEYLEKRVHFPVMIKPTWSSGGGGNLLIEKADSPMLRHLQARHESLQGDFQWLVQEKIERALDWSITASTDSEELKIYLVEYDRHGLSYHHRLVTDHQEKFKSLAEILRQELLAKSYQGPFGFDSFEGQNGKHYPVIDLNVRYTKPHVLEQAAAILNLSGTANVTTSAPVEFYRLRFRGEALSSLDSFLAELFAALSINRNGRSAGETKDGKIFIPNNVSGLGGSGVQTLEISYFLSSASGWSDQIVQKILQLTKGHLLK